MRSNFVPNLPALDLDNAYKQAVDLYSLRELEVPKDLIPVFRCRIVASEDSAICQKTLQVGRVTTNLARLVQSVSENEVKFLQGQRRPEVPGDDLHECVNIESAQVSPELTDDTIRVPHYRFDIVLKQRA